MLDFEDGRQLVSRLSRTRTFPFTIVLRSCSNDLLSYSQWSFS